MTGNKKLDAIILIVMTAATLAVFGLFYYTESLYKPAPTDEAKERQEVAQEQNIKGIPTFYKIDKMVVSLTPKNESPNARMRWLEIEMHLVLFESNDSDLMTTHQAVVKDKIIDITSKMGAEELNSVSGKILLENRLKTEINNALHKPVVKSIYFASFIVQ